MNKQILNAYKFVSEKYWIWGQIIFWYPNVSVIYSLKCIKTINIWTE